MKEYQVDFELRFTNTIFLEAENAEEAKNALLDYAFSDYKVMFDGEELEFDDVAILDVTETN